MGWQDRAISVDVDEELANRAAGGWQSRAIPIDVEPAAQDDGLMPGQRRAQEVLATGGTAGQFLKGAAESVTGAVAGVADLVGNYITAPLTGRERDPNAARNMAQSGVNAVFGDAEPQGLPEQIARGAGRGAVDAATFFMPAGAVAKAAQAGSRTARVAGTLASQPALQTAAGMAGGAVTEATDNPYLGFGAAMAVPFGASAARRALTPFQGIQGALTQQADEVAAAGVPLTAGQKTGNQRLQRIEDWAGVTDEVAGKQRTAINKKVLRSIGVEGDEVTEGALQQARKKIGSKMDELVGQTRVTLGDDFARTLDEVETQHLRRLPSDQRPPLASYIDDMREVMAGGVEPDRYMAIASGLRRAARNARDADVAAGLHRIMDALDDAVEASVGSQVRNQWKQARQQYRNLLQVEQQFKNTSAGDVISGNIGLQQAKKAGRAGVGELKEAGKAAEFLQGTAQNARKASTDKGAKETAKQIAKRLAMPSVAGSAGYALGGPAGTILLPLALETGRAVGRPIAKSAVRAASRSPLGSAYLGNQAFAGPAWNYGTMAPIGAANIKRILEDSKSADFVKGKGPNKANRRTL